MKKTWVVCLLLVMQVGCMLYAQEKVHTVDVFQQGEEGYTCFRIPAIVESTNGVLLAFAEGRKHSCSDTGDIDLVLKRSVDGGQTWSQLITVWDDGDNVCGNPAPIVDQVTGQIVLVFCGNLGEDREKDIIDGNSKDTRKVYVMSSKDDGLTWSVPQDITSSVKHSDWTWYATGPCHGIQLQSGKYKNRLVVSANHMVAVTKAFHSQVIYSDDFGKTWKLGGVVSQPGGNESSVVELGNGSLMLNMRNYNREESKTRSYVISFDGGETWSDMKYSPELIEPVCQGSTLNYLKQGKITDNILFSNPASTDERENMTIRLSKDDGKTWPYSFLVYPGPSAYSDLVVLKNAGIGLLYEYGSQDAYEKIGFSVVSPEQIKL